MNILLGHCTGMFSKDGNMFVIFFLGGLMGSFTHCLAMCGPIVAGHSLCGGCGKSSFHATQWPYHLGRMITYGALGFTAALFGKIAAASNLWPYLSSAMLALAGGMFLISSLPRHLPSPCRITAKNHLLRGALMGFMPCGLLYAALMMAATLASPASGMVAMWLFTLGTMPVLLLAGGSAELLSRKWRHIMPRVGRAVMALNGLSLLVMATRLMR